MALLPFSYGVGILPPPYPFLQYYDCYDDCGCYSSSSDDDYDNHQSKSKRSNNTEKISKKITITNSTVVLVNGNIEDVSSIIHDSFKETETKIETEKDANNKDSSSSSSSSSISDSSDSDDDTDKSKKKKKHRLNIFNH